MDKTAKVKTEAMGGEQSYEGIVVSKPAGKAAMAGEPALRCRCKPRLKRRGLDAKPGTVEEKLTNVEKRQVIRQKPGSQEERRTGAEQKGRPSEAEYGWRAA